MALAVFRFPLIVVESTLSTLMALPRLPHLTQENAALRNELASRQLELAQLREAVRHATRSQELLQALEGFELADSSSKPIVASILGRTTIPSQHVVLLDKGTRHGVVTDSILLEAGGVVGRVLDAHATTSFAILITDPNSRIACVVERSRENGLLVGTGSHLCRLIYLDLEADVVEQDRILTAGLGGPFPKGIMLGTVVKVLRDERSAQTTAWVRPAVTLGRVEEVVCLPPPS